MVFKESLFLNNYNISVFKKKNQIHIYIYNNHYYIIVNISKKLKLNLNKENCIELSYNKPHVYKISQGLGLFLKQFYLCEFTKIKFTGKGYKIKKNSLKSLVLLFNRAHITTIWWKQLFIKKLKKYKLYIKYTSMNLHIINVLLGVRPINIFTKKGLRKSRQILLKKKGKK